MSAPTNPMNPAPAKPVTGELHLAESDQLNIYITDRDYGPAVEVDDETRARWERIAAEFDAWQEELRVVYERAQERDRLLAERAKAERVLAEAQVYVAQRIEALVEFEKNKP